MLALRTGEDSQRRGQAVFRLQDSIGGNVAVSKPLEARHFGVAASMSTNIPSWRRARANNGRNQENPSTQPNVDRAQA